ncbi:hypothetical protein [Ornithinimicrobium cavernae]|uniref:hypothetical protein n=1 Tax=Ornithinimicrobium cavernae TaxID=2666047 RepID=UPI0012B17349|nr:hypothetical protein [Ornithinimicrobium cavernae]
MTPGGSDLALTAPPELVWPAVVAPEDAIRTVARRLHPGVDLAARLYHHPFLGMMFLCGAPVRRFRSRTGAGQVLAAVVVDLVGGRAYLSDPWNDEDFTTRAAALGVAGPAATTRGAAPVRGPAPRLREAEAVAAGRSLLPGVLARRRRLDPVGPAELAAPLIYFGKPNWWVTGRDGDRSIEVVVDALSGRHYVASA